MRGIAEWAGELPTEVMSSLGFRRHLLRLRWAPSRSCFTRVFQRLDGDAFDEAIGAYLRDRARARSASHDTEADQDLLPARAVDGKSLRGSTRGATPRRHLLSVVDHDNATTLGQVNVDTKTNETTGFKPLLAPLALEGTIVTFDAMHTVKELLRWLHQDKYAYYIAIVKPNQPLQHEAIHDLPWTHIPTGHHSSEHGHGRTESRSVKVTAVTNTIGALHFPGATVAIRLHRRRKEGHNKQSRETVYAISNLPPRHALAKNISTYMRQHWTIENQSHHVRDTTFGEDASTVSTGNTPRVMASLRNLAIGALRLTGTKNIAATCRHNAKNPQRALPALGINP